MKQTKLLIDADLILYRAAAAVEKDIRWDEENHLLFSNEEDAWSVVERSIAALTTRFETDDFLCCLSFGRNFRYDVDPTYKSNRKGTRKPCSYSALVERMEKELPTFKQERLEADDIMGIFGSRLEHSIICSMDKDMKTIPATIWDGKQVQKISKTEADYNFFYQVLVGDTADGYPGLPGCGPKGAEKVLKEPTWASVKAAYEAKGLTEDDAIRQARLARILRDGDWCKKTKQPILWTPSKD